MSRDQLAAVVVLGFWLGAVPAFAQPAQDDFHHLGEINKASIVMLSEVGLVPEPMAAEIARGIAAVVAGQAEPGAPRSSDYLDFEALLVEVAGRDASRLHTGRSRQDIGSTFRRLAIRAALLDAYEALLAPRDALLDLAARHTGTIVPAYTHGVQAQPTSLAHYLLAFAAALDRDAERLEETFARLNRSPLGAAALATSGFPLDRGRLAELLGFDGVVENAYDANHVSSVDSKTEVASTLAISALSIGQLMEDVHVQYHDPAPWLVLDRSLTGGQQHHAAEAEPGHPGDAAAAREHRHRRRPDGVPRRPQHVDGHGRLPRPRPAPGDRRQGRGDVPALRAGRQRAGGRPRAVARRGRRRLRDDDRGRRHPAAARRGAVSASATTTRRRSPSTAGRRASARRS